MEYRRLYGPPIFIVILLATALVGIGHWYVSDLLEGFHREHEIRSAKMARDLFVTQHTMPRGPELDVVLSRLSQTTGARLTVIDDDGIVLADTSVAKERIQDLENHAHRPEILQARKASIGISQRQSASIDEPLMYVAARLERPDFKGFVRLAINTDKLQALISNQLRFFIGIGLLVIAMIGIVGLVLVRAFVERLNAERTQLVHARQAVETASNAKDEFLSSMSHELRTPLNAILGFSQVLKFDTDTPLSPAQHESVNFILSSGNHLLKIIDDILDFTHLKTAPQPLEMADMPVQPSIHNAIEMVKELAAQHRVTIAQNCMCNLGFNLRTDPRRFNQILINLLTNAVKYNREGGNVIVQCERTVDECLRVSIVDTGPGIPDTLQAKIFDLFQSHDAHAHTSKSGIGVGLSIAKFLAERMGGRIGFETQEDDGTTFWFELPITPDQALEKEMLFK